MNARDSHGINLIKSTTFELARDLEDCRQAAARLKLRRVYDCISKAIIQTGWEDDTKPEKFDG